MKTLYILFFLGLQSIYSQHVEWANIEYTQILGSQITKSHLLYDTKESIYLYGNQTKIDTTSINMTYVVTDKIGSVTYKNFKNKILFTRVPSKNEVVLIYDNFPNLKWKLSSETKKISKFLVKKAVTTFRGRIYIAWFCEQLPSNNGPLKMGGLPGTILSLETKDDFLKISFQKISYSSKKPQIIDSILTKYDKKVSQEEWNYEVKEKLKDFKSKIMSKQNRNTQFNISFDEPLEKNCDDCGKSIKKLN